MSSFKSPIFCLPPHIKSRIRTGTGQSLRVQFTMSGFTRTMTVFLARTPFHVKYIVLRSLYPQGNQLQTTTKIRKTGKGYRKNTGKKKKQKFGYMDEKVTHQRRRTKVLVTSTPIGIPTTQAVKTVVLRLGSAIQVFNTLRKSSIWTNLPLTSAASGRQEKTTSRFHFR